ncbi:Retrovirus-related Pol polyprotein from transposon [Apostichopus japonicus]|uniref:Retrovirus-related Pol polyprotein from transposon n=1 Tax=Stichopus japonicus TaxID=307972 RepID=A0A2G8K8K8_STIJA|nr:Retrovirus-related Pol polyprotein from transposon [Apostichopus japonicus]
MNDEQRALLKELVTDYADVFARSSADLGYTTVAQHKIDTDNARPVKQPARRVPVQQREVEKLLQQMLDAGRRRTKLSPGKCQLFKQSVTYLGHIVSKDGVGTDPEKVKAVKEWPRPQNLSEVRSFVGLCGYYRRFIRGFAQIALPLFKLTEKKQKFDWNQDCETAFSGLKTALATAPVLSYPMSSGQDFILDTDASDFATGSFYHRSKTETKSP